MILASLGKLSVSQALTAGDTDSTNVIQLDASDWVHWTDVWLSVMTVVAAGGAGAITVNLVLATLANLTTNVSVVQTVIAGITDKRVSTVGRNISAINIGKTLKEMLEEDGSSYAFLGIIYTLGGSATITLNGSISFTEPPTIPHEMVTVSPVEAASIASAGSGF